MQSDFFFGFLFFLPVAPFNLSFFLISAVDCLLFFGGGQRASAAFHFTFPVLFFSIKLCLPSFLFLLLTFQQCQSSPFPCFLGFLLACSPPLLLSGLLWSSVARQVLHRVAESVLDDDAVHRRLWHPQLQPYGPLRFAVLPEVNHPLPLHHIVLLGLLAEPAGGRPPGGSTGSSPGGPGSCSGFCGGRQAARL